MDPMLKIAQRYLAATFIPPFVISTLFFVSFLLIFQLFRLIEIVINNGVEPRTVFEIVFHIAISFLPMAFPLAAFFAIIYTMNKMSEDSEIVAMRAFGMSKRQLLTPFLILGTLISLSIFLLNSELIPYSKSTFRNMVIKLTSDGALTDIKSENFFVDISGVTLFAKEVSDDGKRMKNVFIHVNEDGEQQRVIHSSSGALIQQSSGKYVTPRVRMHLKDGNMTTINLETGDVEKVLFEEYDFPIISSSSTPGFITKDSMRTNSELKEVVEKKAQKYDDLRQAFKKYTPEQKEKQKGKLQNAKERYYESRLQLWTRYNTPLQCLLFIFVGFALGIKQARESKKNTGVMALIVLIAHYALFFGAVSVIKKGNLHPEFGVMLPSFIIFTFGVYLYRKLDWL